MKFLPLPDSLLLCKATIKFVPSKPTVQHYRQNVRSLKIDIYFFISIDIEKLLFFILNCSSNEQCCDTQGNVSPCVIKQRHIQRTPSAVCPAVVMEEGPIKTKQFDNLFFSVYSYFVIHFCRQVHNSQL